MYIRDIDTGGAQPVACQPIATELSYTNSLDLDETPNNSSGLELYFFPNWQIFASTRIFQQQNQVLTGFLIVI